MFKHGNQNYSKRSRNWLKTGLISLLSVALIIVLSGFAVREWYRRTLLPVTAQSSMQVTVVVAPGTGVKLIAADLKQKGLIRQARAFELYVRFNGKSGSLEAGTFSLSPSMSVSEIVASLSKGKDAEKQFTVIPGQRIDQIKKRLITAGFSPADVELAFDPGLYRDIPLLQNAPDGASLEGYIAPDTYNYNQNTRASDIVRRSIEQMGTIVKPDLVERYNKLGLDTHEALTLASIIEEEMITYEDRTKAAQVFLKRLDEGITLGSDVTFIYAAALIGAEATPDLVSPYNTRIVAGLPPGPLGAISAVSLEALAFPANTDYLYFVVGDDGVSYFTRTDAEHTAAVVQHCKIACAPGYVIPKD